MLGIIKMKLRRTNCISGVERGHSVICLVPALKPFAWIDAEDYVGAVLSNQLGRLSAQCLGLSVFKFTIVVTHPIDVRLRNSEYFHRSLFLGLANAG